MFENGDERITDPSFQVVPIGLTMPQIKKYKLPPNPTKLTDSRSPGYVKQFGKICWEVDALNPEVLTQIVEANIESQIDLDEFQSMLTQEEKDITKLKKIINGLK